MAEPTKTDDARAVIEERMLEAELRMEKAIEALHKELVGIRTGRASPALVERLQVHIEAYGTAMPMQQLAGISAPEARSLLIQPYDPKTIPEIEKAIQKSELGLTPNNDGQVIRINIPALNEERRREYVKIVKARGEDARVAIRNIRRDEVDTLRRIEKDGHVSKDEIEGKVADLQKLTDRFSAKIDDAAARKETEILEV